MEKIVVTGAAGFIGSHLTERLITSGAKVLGIDNFFTGKPANIKPFLSDFEFHESDIRDYDTMKDLFKGADAVFHVAALPSVPRSITEPEVANDININGTLSVLRAAVSAGVRRVVFSSSSSAYGDTPKLPKTEDMKPEPLSPYALQKLAGEYYMTVYHKVHGIETVSLRYFNVFGPRQDPKGEYAAVVPKFIEKLASDEKPIIYGDGEQSRDFIYVTNVVDANILAAKTQKAVGELFNIASGERRTVTELANTIADIMGKNIKPVYKPERKGDVKHSHAEISKAKTTLGYKPKVGLEEGLKKTIEFFVK